MELQNKLRSPAAERPPGKKCSWENLFEWVYINVCTTSCVSVIFLRTFIFLIQDFVLFH